MEDMVPPPATMSDLPIEILRHILLLLSISTGGAADVIRVAACCKTFMEFLADEKILKALNFDGLLPCLLDHSLWEGDNILTVCRRVGNTSALGVIREYMGNLVTTYKESTIALLTLYSKLDFQDTSSTQRSKQELFEHYEKKIIFAHGRIQEIKRQIMLSAAPEEASSDHEDNEHDDTTS